MKKIGSKYILLVLSTAGIIDSLYLTYIKLANSSPVCGFAQCEIVQTSRYSEVFGIPIAALGAGYYLILFAGIFKNADYLNKLWILWGIMFSATLTYLEIFVIKAICGWCVLSFVNILMIAIIYFLKRKKTYGLHNF